MVANHGCLGIRIKWGGFVVLHYTLGTGDSSLTGGEAYMFITGQMPAGAAGIED
jgi:hypothetical protein